MAPAAAPTPTRRAPFAALLLAAALAPAAVEGVSPGGLFRDLTFGRARRQPDPPPLFMDEGTDVILAQDRSKVRVDFFVMSKCPDAALCEQTFLPVLKNLASVVNVSFEFIGAERQGVPECMHGPSECMGNRQQICAQQTGDVSKLLDFVACQAADDANIPENGEACLKKTGLGKEVNDCIDSEQAATLLSNSFGKSRGLNIFTSCTVNVEGQEFCVHDGEWKSCDACQ
eukprot:CAMPEP_0168421518 /NCGR_PEP_ID=MMETSP0228-20121227/33322_1 /TAXON_ID=133427 /ORGANISM="Protoceratium reticulatum, Strain CCCM 535 (=CCMP 1889)" /LENGTH=228 /DNA_ID=CAMNT_0008435427 /DNA_START=45 /DNA_END=728 /DNA_ORIENTATION=+